MSRTGLQLRTDALQIWQAGVQAVQPSQLIPEFVTVDHQVLKVGDEEIELRRVNRLLVVGAGKAGASMATALETTLGDEVLRAKQVEGWVNVPADCLQTTRTVQLHAARPAGVNEPTPAGVSGAQEILRLVASAGPQDLCICLLSGGGSALLPAPVNGFTLQQKAEITREIAARGGSIQQLNAVRRELSNIKGGGLARACRAGRLITLILSDVLGDDLEVIASGPTILREPTPHLALKVIEELQLEDCAVGREAAALLRHLPARSQSSNDASSRVTNIVIGNNATAVDAAGIEAERLGYSHAMISANKPEPTAEEVAQHLVEQAILMRSDGEPDCLIAGGEPTVRLAPASERGLGGRNQQLALSALASLDDWNGIALVSGGTDGEDGPTDAAGAFVDAKIAKATREQSLVPDDYLRRNDAYHFFEKTGGLLKTGPTHTNVCDLRVITVAK